MLNLFNFCNRVHSSFTLIFLSLIILSGILQGCQTQQDNETAYTQLSENEERLLSDTILALTQRFSNSWHEMNVDSILGSVSDDFRYFRGGVAMSSKDEFSHALDKYIIPNAQNYSSEILNPKVEIFGPNAAVSSFLFRASAPIRKRKPGKFPEWSLMFLNAERATGKLYICTNQGRYLIDDSYLGR